MSIYTKSLIELLVSKVENKDWSTKIKNNFDNAADKYLTYSKIQRFTAKKIIKYLKKLNLEKGEWIDLGSGTGLLADEIEMEFSNQKVSRIDFSKKMLKKNKSSSKKILYDLNNKLPPFINNCALMTSNFCIHWLDQPEIIIKNWFSKLKPGGYLIIAYPTKDSFSEWKETCIKIGSEYSGLRFLNAEKISKNFKSNEIIYSKKFIYLENFPDVYKLFRSIINVGAQSSKCKRKSVGELKNMQKFWPKIYNNRVNLTWEISIQIIKKS